MCPTGFQNDFGPRWLALFHSSFFGTEACTEMAIHCLSHPRMLDKQREATSVLSLPVWRLRGITPEEPYLYLSIRPHDTKLGAWCHNWTRRLMSWERMHVFWCRKNINNGDQKTNFKLWPQSYLVPICIFLCNVALPFLLSKNRADFLLSLNLILYCTCFDQ